MAVEQEGNTATQGACKEAASNDDARAESSDFTDCLVIECKCLLHDCSLVPGLSLYAPRNKGEEELIM